MVLMSGKVIRCDIYDVFMYEAFYAIWYHLYNLKMWKIVLVKRTFIKVAVCFFFIFFFQILSTTICMLLAWYQMKQEIPAIKIRKEWSRKIFNFWTKSHFSNFEMGWGTFPWSRKFLSVFFFKATCTGSLDTGLKIFPYIQIRLKIIPWKFSILNPKNSRVIHL